MKKLILQVSAIRECDGGYTCNLLANGKKVAFIGPGIFEWINHARSMEVMEWFANHRQIKLPEPKPTKMDENWQPDVPDHKQNKLEELVESQLIEWVKLYVKAHEIQKNCKETVISVNKIGDLFDWKVAPKIFNSKQDVRKIIEAHDSTVLNGKTALQILKYLEDAKFNLVY